MMPGPEPPEPEVDLIAEHIPFDRFGAGQPARHGGASADDAPGARRVWYDDVAICRRPAPSWLIENLIPDQALVFLWALPETGKTFFALLVALCITTGRACLGRAVRRQGGAIFVVGEGAAHFGRRIVAWKVAYHWPVDDAAGLQIHDGPLDLLNDAAVDRFVWDARAFAPAFVVLDTLARCTPGADENSAREMGIAVRNLDRIKTDLACTVLVLAHANKGGTAERGSSALRGAADAMFAMERVDDLLVLRPDKSKDFGLPDVINLELAEVEGAHSMLVRQAGTAGAAVTTFELAALRALRDNFPDGAKSSELQTAANLKERTAYRVVARLVDLNMVVKAGPALRLTEYGRLVADRGTGI